jgi:hypothetical protein
MWEWRWRHVKTLINYFIKVIPYTSGKIWSARFFFLFFLAVCLNISTVINITYDVCMQISSISVIKTTEWKAAMWLVNL